METSPRYALPATPASKTPNPFSNDRNKPTVRTTYYSSFTPRATFLHQNADTSPSNFKDLRLGRTTPPRATFQHQNADSSPPNFEDLILGKATPLPGAVHVTDRLPPWANMVLAIEHVTDRLPPWANMVPAIEHGPPVCKWEQVVRIWHVFSLQEMSWYLTQSVHSEYLPYLNMAPTWHTNYLDGIWSPVL